MTSRHSRTLRVRPRVPRWFDPSIAHSRRPGPGRVFFIPPRRRSDPVTSRLSRTLRVRPESATLFDPSIARRQGTQLPRKQQCLCAGPHAYLRQPDSHSLRRNSPRFRHEQDLRGANRRRLFFLDTAHTRATENTLPHARAAHRNLRGLPGTPYSHSSTRQRERADVAQR